MITAQQATAITPNRSVYLCDTGRKSHPSRGVCVFSDKRHQAGTRPRRRNKRQCSYLYDTAVAAVLQCVHILLFTVTERVNVGERVVIMYGNAAVTKPFRVVVIIEQGVQ